MITKIRMVNYKGFKNETISFNSGRNILVGENGCGKSSILAAIHLLINGSLTIVEKIGFEALFNVEVINDFLSGDLGEKGYNNLPKLIVELYFSDDWEENNFLIRGKQNLDKKEESGLKLVISPNDTYSTEISDILVKEPEVFPFDYYKANFETFGGHSYNSYNKQHKTKSELIDSSSISVNSSMKKFVSSLFSSKTTDDSRKNIKHNFRSSSEQFSKDMYSKYGILDDEKYKLKIKSPTSDFVDQFIMAHQNNLDINNLGQGEKLLIGIDSILKKNAHDSKVVLIEEPENHLSYLNMKNLINLIEGEDSHQLFISTHSNMIASRLDLSKVIFLRKSGSVSLTDLKLDTESFFKKAPNTNVLNFILSRKVVLVEGDAEYILMDWFFRRINSCSPEEADVGIISCGGKAFKRYIELANKLNIEVAIITDNDGVMLSLNSRVAIV